MFPNYGLSAYPTTCVLLGVMSSRSSFTECVPTESLVSDDYKVNQQDLIHLKSPSTSNTSDSKRHRRKSVEIADLHRIDRSATIDRFSTCLTPSATSFSREELNEIFNIGRTPTSSDMDAYGFQRNNSLLDSSDQESSVHDVTPHNMAFDDSAISVNSVDITIITPTKKNGSQNDLHSSTTHTENSPNTSPQNSLSTRLPPTLDLQEISAFNSPNKEHNSETDNLFYTRSPFTPSPDGNKNPFSKIQLVCREIFMTEKSYVNDLQEVIEGYIYHLKQHTELDVESIFGNLEDIYEFNKELLYQLEECESEFFEIDPICIAKVFIEKSRTFNHHYVQYCTNYPEASSFFSIIMQDPNIRSFFLERQKVIGHALPLESYLLKPVQRIMKYHLLFRDILKKYEGDEDGYNIINTAVLAMGDVADYINEMKRLHENAVKVQEILSRITDLDVPIDIFATGRLVLENSFKVQGSRGDRVMYLFEKLLLICKKYEDHFYQFKEKIECSNMMLVESLPKDPLAFQIMRFDNQKVNYTIMAKTIEIKKEWTQHLKRLILENHAAMIPQTARQAILGTEEKKSKYNSLPINALDDSVMGNLRNLKSKGNPKALSAKEYVAAGVKRESNEKENSNSPKRSLNTKAREYLEKKSRSNLNNHMQAAQYMSSDKEKKEKKWNKKKHQKHKPSLENILIFEMNDKTGEDQNLPGSVRNKSRSLESLKDNIRLKQDVLVNEPVERSILQEIINHDFEKQVEKPNSRPISMAEVETLTDVIINTPSMHQTTISSEGNDDNKHDNEDLSGLESSDRKVRKISKSFSLNMLPKNDDSKRWSKLSDTDPMEILEKRLSMINDDEMSAESIKNMVRRVSNAFNSSFRAYDDSPKSVASTEINVSRNIILNTGSPSNDKLVNRRSTGDIHKSFISSIRIRSRSALSVYDESKLKTKAEDVPTPKENLIYTEIEVNPVEQIEKDEESNRWSADVDQVFDEVNADLDSIADSISSDANNESASPANTPEPPTTTTAAMNVHQRVALVDERLKLADDEQNISPSASRKMNVEVKRVADRIKEYKKLIDAERQRNSWRRREPRTITEMIETLDSISTISSSLSPVYASHRRRFKSSRDYENDGERKSSEESILSPANLRNFSENFNLENSKEHLNDDEKCTGGHNFSGSSSSLSSTDALNIKNSDNHLENFPSQKKSKFRTSVMGIESGIRIHRSSSDVSEFQKQLDNKEWIEKATLLPNPRRANALKQRTRQMSEDILPEKCESHEKTLQKSFSLDIDKIAKPLEKTKPKSKKWVEIPTKKKNLRLFSEPSNDRQKLSDKTVQEEDTIKQINSRLPNRTTSDCSSPLAGSSRLSRGRSETIKSRRTSSRDNSSKYMSLPRTKKKVYTESSNKKLESSSSGSESPGNVDSSNNNHRSTSLPRRAKKLGQIEFIKREIDADHNSILRSPSIKCIQQNHVNARIKEYFTNLQRSTQISRSRPNLLLIGSDSEDENVSSSSASLENDDVHLSPTTSDNSGHILRGTVRSMIKRYGESNYVFDKF